eukprot:scaffold543362_cov19-Prasinocladus_malaysianus.AAC.1
MWRSGPSPAPKRHDDQTDESIRRAIVILACLSWLPPNVHSCELENDIQVHSILMVSSSRPIGHPLAFRQ